ncbi:VCBS repeat-containing protein [Streptomyces sp. NPDC001941]|uniref:FG-GAP repeat domain-containing protein n=1 Tax=Streptomyces sp. NPDC001941 TaxID=3154659 RepID=UPI00331ED084
MHHQPLPRRSLLRRACIASLAAASLATAAAPVVAAEPGPDARGDGSPAASTAPSTPGSSPTSGEGAGTDGEASEVAAPTIEQVNVFNRPSSKGQLALGVRGTGTPGATVYADTSGRVEVAKVASNGTFTGFIPESAIQDGAYVFHQRDADGVAGPSVSVAQDEVVMRQPTFSSPANGATVTPGFRIRGDAVAYSTVEVTFNGADPQTVTASSSGSWTVNRSGQKPGPVKIEATASAEGTHLSVRSQARSINVTVPGAVESELKAEDLAESVTADFDGDDKADLVARNDADGKLYQFKGKGDGTFDKGSVLYDTWDYSHTAAGDFNGDGKADIVATDGTKAWLWRGNGDGTFTKDTKALTNWPAHLQQVSGGDFDNDGIADIAAVNTNENKAYLWRGIKGDTGNPFAPPQYLTNWGNFTQATAGDADGDGTSDIMALDPNGTLKVWISTGDVTKNPFKAPVTIMPFGTHEHLTLGDHNGDGKADVLAVDTTTNEIKTYQSNGTPGTGMLTTPKTIELTIPAAENPQK